ncbi:hypothetical protein [Streptomyces sp. WAC08401]|uniref:hypothetical protein n=1 Tax=Streptomyces sp. WAC08401 TaxID=2487413 RepID=UPI000FBA58F9|nr:hypothetical protein [Streptomyces sp. WAC08401]RSS11378.1 hypothetical protein EF915_24835 [Streptomyces sp. WAC08401]
MTNQPAEYCGNISPGPLGHRTECVLRPGHQGSHADHGGGRWWVNGPAPVVDTTDVRQQAETWRRKAVRRALTISKLTGTLQAVTELASEEITARTEWGDGYRAAITDLQEVLCEFGHPPFMPAHDSGPTVAEAAADDRRWWTDKYAGEGQ